MAWARDAARSDFDLDPDLEAAGIELVAGTVKVTTLDQGKLTNRRVP